MIMMTMIDELGHTIENGMNVAIFKTIKKHKLFLYGEVQNITETTFDFYPRGFKYTPTLEEAVVKEISSAIKKSYTLKTSTKFYQVDYKK